METAAATGTGTRTLFLLLLSLRGRSAATLTQTGSSRRLLLISTDEAELVREAVRAGSRTWPHLNQKLRTRVQKEPTRPRAGPGSNTEEQQVQLGLDRKSDPAESDQIKLPAALNVKPAKQNKLSFILLHFSKELKD